MGGKSSSKIEVNRYLMSIHLGICLGPVDAITAAYYGEKKYWSGYNTDNASYSISNTGLFGGDKKEGGIQGSMTLLMGRSNQVMPDDLARKLGRASGLDCPGFRGITSVFHTGPSSGGLPGWLWCANSPYLKGMWYTVMAIPKTLGAANSRLNPSEIDLTFSPIGYQGTSFSSSLYASLGVGLYSIDEMLRKADELVPSSAPHRVEYVTEGNCSVIDGKVADSDGLVRAGNFGPGGPATPYAHILTYGGVPHVDVWEAYRIGVGNATSGGYAKRPNVPVIRLSGAKPATYDANPAHIIYEVMTNGEYGMGQDPVAVNTQSFVDAAKTLFDEGLGLSMAWSTSTAAGDFIEEVKQHINALIFPDPETDKTTLKLVRDDYDVATLRSVNPDNGTMTTFSRKAWGDTINEIVVTWTNPATEQEETVTLQDNGNIAEQGEVISDAKNYYGVRSAELAWKLAARDLRVAAAPLCSAEIDLDRSFWNIRPGDCIKVSWPEYGMTDLVMRVWEVKYGSGRVGGSKITVSVTEDIFSLPVSAFVQPPSTEWVDPSSDPEPVDTATVMTLPIYIAAKVGGVSAGSFEYPVAYAGILAAAPNSDTATFDLLGQSIDATGNYTWENRGRMTMTGRGSLLADLVAETSSTVPSFNVESGAGPAQSVFLRIGGADDSEAEITLVMSQSDTGWTVKRGVLDTVPKNWPTGTEVWFLASDFLFADDTTQSAGSNPVYKLLSNTSKGQLADSMAPIVTGQLTDRLHRPLRPANVKVENVGFGQVVLPTSGKVNATWSRRNRLMEETVVMGWTDPDITPETGQTTNAVLLDANTGAEISRVSGITGTSAVIDVATLLSAAGSSASEVLLAAESERDGLRSLQSHGVKVLVYAGGYGVGYGEHYG